MGVNPTQAKVILSIQSSWFLFDDLFSPKTSKQKQYNKQILFLVCLSCAGKKKHVPTQVHSGPPPAFIPI